MRVVDHDVRPGVVDDAREGDGWPAIRQQIGAADVRPWSATRTEPTTARMAGSSAVHLARLLAEHPYPGSG